jgi:hypothetical protein
MNTMIRRVCVAVAAMAMCFGAAAKPPMAPMPVAAELPVELIENQNELAVDVSNTAGAIGMQFGLIGALIGAGIQNAQAKKAEERVVPLRDLLINYHFNERLEQGLRAKLASDGLSPHPDFNVMKTPWDAVDAQQARNAPPQALVLYPRYSIDSGFSQLTVQVTAQLVHRTLKPNGRIKSSYDFIRTYAYHFPMQSTGGPDPVQHWTQLGDAGLARVLDEGIAQATDMLVYDFSAQGRAEWTQPVDGSVTVRGITYRGRPLRHDNDWAWVRVGRKWAQSIQGYHPIDGIAATIAAVPSAGGAPAPVAVTAPAAPAPIASDAPVPVAPLAAAATAMPTSPATSESPASVAVPVVSAGAEDAGAARDPQPPVGASEAAASGHAD